MIEKEAPKIPTEFILPKEIGYYELRELYKKLSAYTLQNLNRMDELHTQASHLYAEMEYKFNLTEQAQKLLDMHRTLPKGCFKLPDYRE